MTQKEINKLNAGASVMHKRYGECTVKEILMVGVVLVPKTKEGRMQVIADFGVDAPTLEDNIRNIKHL